MKTYQLFAGILAVVLLLSLSSVARAHNLDGGRYSNWLSTWRANWLADHGANRHDRWHPDIACPVGLVSGLTLTEEFGIGVAANTRCIKKRHEVKSMFVINAFHAAGSHTAPYALHQVENVYKDYTITDGMKEGRDFKIIAVVQSKGGMLLLNDANLNPYKAEVKKLMSDGVTFFFCENTARGFIQAGLLQPGHVANGLISGVKYVTSGPTAMSDFESEGYRFVEP